MEGTVSVETGGRVLIGARARLVSDQEKLVAWAERHVRVDPDLKWIVGNFVQADLPNDNGHIFPLADLETAHKTVQGKPLNMIHHERYIVGAFAGTELIHPDQDELDAFAAAGDLDNGGTHRTCKSCGGKMAKDVSTCPNCGAKYKAEAAAGAPLTVAHVEAVAGMWHRIFPDEYALVKKAHADGALFYSMEALPESLTCPECAMTAAYAGPTSDTYCAHMNAPRGMKALNKPVFGGGAIIIPPIRPGWRRADISKLDEYLKEADDGGQSLYVGLASEFGHLSPDVWEWMMARIVSLADQ